MYLKSITLKGFKSFPDRTRLEFGPGVSVVVGPNGSGKSNITDAVLWALGEQSPIAVRGQSMQDVIFAGAPGRQASKAAEVELVLDDSDGVLGLGVPEVSILRRLDRSGEGEYRLAGARCRLIDVIEVLSDTGLGREMHSVISQGRVEAIVTSKPRDRRMLIEEAAGLGKHRKRRRRAQLKLIRTGENLDRALDVEREARSRLRPLKRQAEAAELHARLERQTLEARWELARDDLRARLLELAKAESQAGDARAERARLEAEFEAIAARRHEAEEALTQRSARREELSRRCFVAQSALERVSYRSEAVRSAANALDARIEQHERAHAALLERERAEAPDPGAAERIASLEAKLVELERDREAELERALGTLGAELEQAREAVKAHQAGVSEAEAERGRVEARLETSRGKLTQIEHELRAARLHAAETGSALAAVNQFLRTHSGAVGGAAQLSDELEVDAGCELAVAAALDGRLRAVLVPDLDSATELLDGAGAEGGRALITERAEGGGDAAQPTPPVPGARPLSDLVRGPARAVGPARALLRGCWLVESLEALGADFQGLAVTPAGRVFSVRSGEMWQAPALGEEQVLAQRNRREQLVKDTESAAGREVAALRERDGVVAELESLEAERDEVLARLREAHRQHDEALEAERRVLALIDRRRHAPDASPTEALRLTTAAELRAEKERVGQVERERAQRQARIELLTRALERDHELAPAVRSLVRTLQSVADAIASQRASFEVALVDDRAAGEHVAAELRECAKRETTLQAELHRCNESLTQAEVALQRSRDHAAELEQELRTIAARLELDASPLQEAMPESDRDALQARLDRLGRRREQLGPVNPLAQQEYAEAIEHVEELERQRTDLETALRELQQLIADTDRQITELFERTFAAAARNFEVVCSRLFPGGRGRLRLLAEREGPARVLGGEERPGEDPEDSDEGAAPEADELGVEIEINPAGKEMRRLSLLSGGEKAMTALAFLFAVFLASPCPFYILDEVEAALDDVNIDRFLGLVRSYSGQAQFIVVTHQRRTMEAADILYGVSMGGDGISKVISRRLPQEQAAA